MTWSRGGMMDTIITEKFLELFTGELAPIVGNYVFGKSKITERKAYIVVVDEAVDIGIMSRNLE